MRFGLLITLSIITTVSNAQTFSQIESLIAATWAPHEVTCLWEPIFGDPSVISNWQNVSVSSALEACAHDQLTLTLEGVDSSGIEQKLTVKGRARIFGKAYSVRERVKVGEEVKATMLESLECEWGNLRAAALLDPNAIAGKFAVRPLVPGRVILACDVRPRTLVRSGDTVSIYCVEGGVNVKIQGVAMKDGGAGETIPVRVPEVDKNRLEGVIQDDSTLVWIP